MFDLADRIDLATSEGFNVTFGEDGYIQLDYVQPTVSTVTRWTDRIGEGEDPAEVVDHRHGRASADMTMAIRRWEATRRPLGAR